MTRAFDEVLASIRFDISERADGQAVLWLDDEPILVGSFDEVERAFDEALTAEQREALRFDAEVADDLRAADRAEARLSHGGFEPAAV